MYPQKITVAEHLLTQTYPSLQDPKILVSVLQNVLEALEDGVTRALDEARRNHEVPPYSDTLNGKLTAFKLHLAKKKGFTPIDFMLISEIQEILSQHKISPVEFRKKNILVIADEEYHLRTLSEDKTKTYLRRAKALLARI